MDVKRRGFLHRLLAGLTAAVVPLVCLRKRLRRSGCGATSAARTQRQSVVEAVRCLDYPGPRRQLNRDDVGRTARWEG